MAQKCCSFIICLKTKDKINKKTKRTTTIATAEKINMKTNMNFISGK
ncbi:hypothetical protein DOY81_006027 [Sarcophaga bullata]|nr:hypothetical protein DOY81_006027 [Sarcophaga bullata]